MSRAVCRALSLWLMMAVFAVAHPGPLCAQETLPAQLAGSWKITRVLAVSQGACYSRAEARPLLGSTLHFSQHTLRWRGGRLPITGIVTHSVNSNDLKAESAVSGTGQAPELRALSIPGSSALEVNLQHEDADVTGSTTEVPGDTVLLAGPGRIVVSACGVYMEARRLLSTRGDTVAKR